MVAFYKHLRRKYVKRRKKGGRKKGVDICIPDRISITMRPEIINNREHYGDWESDSVLFSHQKQARSVQYERKSQWLRWHLVADKSAVETTRALTQTFKPLPEPLKQSCTVDNGGENYGYTIIRDSFKMETYFCEPYHSWQKGGGENINGLLRQYLPRQTAVSKLTEEDIHSLQEKFHNRLRKSLDGLTPNEVIAEFLKSKVGH